MIAHLPALPRIIALLLAAASANAEGGELSLRSVLHNPLNPQAELYVPTKGGGLEALNLSLEGFTLPQQVAIEDGRLLLYDSQTIDPEAPLQHLAASAAVPAKAERAIALIFDAGKKAKLPYRLIMLDDSPEAFPKGSSRILNLTPMKLAMNVGGQALKLPPGRMKPLPPVDQVNHMNQAQTTFYREGDDDAAWVPFADRPMQFSRAARNLIIIYQMPGLKQPRLRTLIDTDLR